MRLFIALLFISATACAAPVDPAAFKVANDAYAAENFDVARSDYEALVKGGNWSANLFYNLGNTYYRTHDFGRAVLDYRRALALDPHHPEADANLRVANDEAHALQLPRSYISRAAERVNGNALSVAAAIAGWLALFAFTFAGFVRRSSAAIRVGIISAVAALACAAVVYMQAATTSNLAIVTRPDVQARVAIAANAQPILPLPAGSEVQIIEQRGDWSYALLPNGQRGWLPADAVERIRL